MTDTPTREEIEAFIESLADGAVEPWSPTSWRDVDDPDDNSYRVMVGFQYDPTPAQERRFGPDKHDGRSEHALVIDSVRQLEGETDYGAPRDQVIQLADDEGVANPAGIVTELKNRGEIYEPQEDILRTV